jgi:RNA polymerase sigma-70 factor (ECF subfamily)
MFGMASLAARLAAGEDSAFAELYDACADSLHRYAWSRLGSAEAARDVVQTVFLRAAASRRRFAGVENPAAYVFTIARNETVRAQRRAGRRRWEVSVGRDGAGDGAAKPASGDAEDAEAVRAALARLADEDREIVELKVYGGLTFAEIGAAIDRPAATAATRYRRALESLRGWLARQLR